MSFFTVCPVHKGPLATHPLLAAQAEPTESADLLNLAIDRLDDGLPASISIESLAGTKLVTHLLSSGDALRRCPRSRRGLFAVGLALGCNVCLGLTGLGLIGSVSVPISGIGQYGFGSVPALLVPFRVIGPKFPLSAALFVTPWATMSWWASSTRTGNYTLAKRRLRSP
jgi:hypothetical protein